VLGGIEFALARFGSRETGLPGFFAQALKSFAVSMVLVTIFTLLLDRRGLGPLGWAPSRQNLVDLLFGCFLGAALITTVVAVEWAAGWLTLDPQRGAAPAGAITRAFVLFVVAATAEEVVFRSYLLRNLADALNHRRIGPRRALLWGTVVSSVLFGVVHAGNPNVNVPSLLNIVLAGVFLSAGYLLTGRLGLAVGLHIFWNLFQSTVFGLPVSGISLHTSVLTFRQHGPTLWTGGDFGIEGGLLGFVALLVGTAASVAWVRYREGALRLATELVITSPEKAPRDMPPPPEAEPSVLA
jgi:uncharacterized protein